MTLDPSIDITRIQLSYQMMTLGIVGEILMRADNLGAVGEYIVSEARELSGARTVLLFQDLGDRHRLISISPERRRPLGEHPVMQDLLMFSHEIQRATSWTGQDEPGRIGQLLRSLDVGPAIGVPLSFGANRVGLLLLCDVFPSLHTQALLPALDMLSSLIALVLRQSILFENQESIIAERTLKLEQSERTFRSLATVSPVGIFRADEHGEWVYVNERWCEMTGMPLERALGSGWIAAVHPDDRPTARENWRLFLQGSTPFAPELRFQGSGGITWALGQATAERDASGRVMGFVGAFTDLTERKQAEKEHEKLQTQLTQAQKMESIGRLAGGVAHDFNNMLGVILGHVEMALEEVTPAQSIHGDLEEIRKAAERSADLTRQLLAFARKQTAIPRVLDLNETVAGMLKMLRRLIGENIELIWIPGAKLAPVTMDPTQINQMLANLCVNARDAIGGVGKITIKTAGVTFADGDATGSDSGIIPGDYVMLAVSDDGCGMDKETLAKVFEPFFTTKSLGQGTGLGLATLYGIVKQNHGFVNVYSEPGMGTAFRIYLPRHRGATAAGQAATSETPFQRGQETLLLVEDEPAILNLGKTMLGNLGYRVLAAGTPGEAIRLAREHAGEIHLVITDVVMPEMNGRDLAKILLSLYPNSKRLFMSGYTADVIAHHGVLDEGVHFIQKPFSMKELAAKTRLVLDGE